MLLSYRLCPICLISNPIKLTKLDREEYTECKKCGLLYTHKIVKISDFAEYYDSGRDASKNYHEDYINNKDEHDRNRRLARQMQLLSEESWDKKDILEIGSSAGYLLDEAKSMGARVVGIEISKYAANYASGSLGINTVNDNWETFDPSDMHWNSKFDFVIMSHVLEHFVNPFDAIKKISNVLRLGGAWITQHPDASVFPGVKFHVRDNTPNEHLQIFDESNILLATEPNGLRRVLYNQEEPGQSISIFRKMVQI